ncbi:inositol-1-monophosphatase SuhB [Methyloglobulus morosus KoM1]|uniref:Inositol-1-monophosphatase SuhB n=2 Tax=Methyloglobulus TaxID=1410680 RepID=V5AYH2_9GAMM|nr:inositol-1-monophosphatase SuhB [Methyloglobulus morosus KoM1]
MLYHSDFQRIRDGLNPETSIDQAIDEHLQLQLPKIFKASYLSEETIWIKPRVEDWCWIVDPVDGTENLIAGSPNVATSVALINPGGECVLGAIHAPLLKETFSGVRGAGAFLNGEHLTGNGNISRNILSMAFPCRGPAISDLIGGQVASLLRNSWTIRASGSAALDICNVARGRWSAFFEESTYSWDIAAASLIAEEAGCFVSTATSKHYGDDPHVRGYLVAATRQLHSQLELILKGNNVDC